jgi:hypothetical protein
VTLLNPETHREGSLTAEIGAIADECLSPEQEAVILATLRSLPERPKGEEQSDAA